MGRKLTLRRRFNRRKQRETDPAEPDREKEERILRQSSRHAGTKGGEEDPAGMGIRTTIFKLPVF